MLSCLGLKLSASAGEPLSFSKFTRVTTLNLSRNSIGDITGHGLEHMISLTHLDLHDNRIAYVATDSQATFLGSTVPVLFLQNKLVGDSGDD